MKIRLYSDLHLEFESGFIPPVHEDDSDTVLILAGDIHVGIKGVEWARKLSPRFKMVLYVAGNHEYYDHSFDTLSTLLQQEAYHVPNLHVLDPGSVILNNVRFIGATLWTDFDSNNPNVMFRARLTMNDYQYIKMRNEDGKKMPLSPQRVYARHKRDLNFVLNSLEDKSVTVPTVVITHHLPSYGCIHPKYKGAQTNPYYASELGIWMTEHSEGGVLKAWVFGHSHESANGVIGNCKYYSNPFGYYKVEENKNFDPNFSFEVEND